MIFKLIKKLKKKKSQYTFLRPHFTVEAYRVGENKPFKTHKVSDRCSALMVTLEHLEFNPIFHTAQKHELKRVCKIIKPCGCVEEVI